ncbi:MAG: sigma-70 family RNA polymerase sigma factor, partial [Bacillota bacterium]
ASEVFTVVWNKCDSYSDERGSFRTWVLILSKYKALDYRRRLSRHNKNISTENIELESSDSVENSIITKDENSRIMQAIKCLKEIDREIFYRRYFFYESIESIANRLGLTRENIDNRLCRGRKKIREILFDYGKGEVV